MTELRLGGMVAEDSGGGGPTIVLIHGLGGTSNTFEPLMPHLTDYRVIRPDLPGAGRSLPKPGIPGLNGMTQAVIDLVRAAGVSQAHFVGHSMGTLICQYLAVKNPAMVKSLALYGPILEPPPAARAALRDRAAEARENGMSGIAEAISTGSVADASREANPVVKAFVRESLLRQQPSGYAAHCLALSEATAADHGAIQCPTTLIAGGVDPVAPVSMATAIRESISGAQLEIIPNVSHWMMMEAPTASAELMTKHLAGCTA